MFYAIEKLHSVLYRLYRNVTGNEKKSSCRLRKYDITESSNKWAEDVDEAENRERERAENP